MAKNITGRLRFWLGGMLMTVLFGVAAAQAEEAQEPIRGLVAETMNSGGYTYVQLDRKGSKQWFATPESLVRPGDEVEVQPGVQMGSYTSPTLKRTFENIEFSPGLNVVKRVVSAAGGGGEGGTQEGVKVAKAEGPDAFTVAEVFAQKETLNGKKAVVRGKVVKVSQFSGRNWLRLVDGTGSSKRGDHKLVVTTDQDVAQDDIVQVSGTVTTGKSFGALTYEVLVEEAKVEKQGK